MFRTKLYGGFDLLDSKGRSICPASQKQCALIAILALSENQRRSRKWLQATLWCERSDQQASASLRQALTQLRKLFSPHDVLVSDRTNVALNPEAISCSEADDGFRPRPGYELLEGIDVRDEAFEDWLRDERQYRAVLASNVDAPATPAASTSPTIKEPLSQPSTILIVEPPIANAGDERGQALARAVTDEVLSAAQLIGMRIVFATPELTEGSGFSQTAQALPEVAAVQGLHLVVKVNSIGSHGLASLSLFDSFRCLVWSVREEIDLTRWARMRRLTYSLSNEFLSFIIEREERLSVNDAAARDAIANAAVALLGIVRPHSVSVERMSECASAAMEMSPHGLYRALHATAEVFRYAERFDSSPALQEQALEHFQTALREASGNALVNALAGHAHSMFLRDPAQGLPLTQRGAGLAPNNALCLAFYALSLIYAGRPREAHRTARRALNLSGMSLVRNFVEGICSFTSLLCGDPKQSLQMGAAALTMAPGFRPIVTNVATAAALTGDGAMARRGFRKLRQLDSEFSIQKVETPEYPLINQEHRALVLKGMKAVSAQLH